MLMLLCIGLSAQVTFEWVHPKPVGSSLYDVASGTRGSLVAVGMNGTIIYSRDSGSTWDWIQPDFQRPYYRVEHLGEESFLLSGNRGRMLMTDDGGASWREVDNGESQHFLSGLTSIHGTIIMAVGGTLRPSNAILRSSDRGQSWSPIDLGIDAILTDVQLLENGIGWIVGHGGSLFRSSDSGATWRRIEIPYTTNAYESVSADGKGNVIVGERTGFSIVSHDSGTSWTVVDQSRGTYETIQGARWIDADVVHAFNNKSIMISTDGGLSFETMGVPNPVLGVDFDTATDAYWLVGSRGLVAVSYDSGGYFTRLSEDQSEFGGTSGHHIAAPDASRVVVLDGDRASFLTMDSGRTWQSEKPRDFVQVNNICWPGPEAAFAVLESGQIYDLRPPQWEWDRYTSTPSGQSLGGVDFLNEDFGVVVGNDVYGTTTDGGINWHFEAGAVNGDFTAVQVVTRDFWAAGGPNGLFAMTTDGGKSWTYRPTPATQPMENLTFANPDTGICVYYTGMMYTSDGGTTWENRLLPPTAAKMTAAKFWTPLSGWALARQDGLYRTTDGGVTWTHHDFHVEEGAGATTFSDLTLLDESTGWMAGSRGFMLRFRPEKSTGAPDVPAGAKTDVRLLSIYPNPAETEITVDVGSGSTSIDSVAIYRVNGEKVIRHVDAGWRANSIVTISVESLTSGAYYAVIDGPNGKQISQLFIVRR